MRTEQEMMDLILETARRDSRVLAVYLKGSRANKNVPKDVYQDFDIMYVVKEVAPFQENPAWLDVFGEVILKQEQDDDFGYGERFGIRGDYDKSYSWLLLFADGNRIDIGVETLETMEQGKTDFVIAYVIRGEGGAYTAVEYARKKGKKVCLI